MRISGETNQQKVFVNQTAANADKTASAKDKNPEPQKMQGDVVDISDEGIRRSRSGQSQNAQAANDGEDNGNSGGEMGSGKVAAAKLEEELQTKKSEAKRKQEKLDSLKRQAEDEPSQEGEAKKLQSEIDSLKREEKKIRSEMNS